MKRHQIFAVILSFFTFSQAYANLQVFPTRVVLTEKNRAAQIALRHIGSAPAKYRVSSVYYKMKPDGSLEMSEKTTSADRSAAGLFRFSPQQVQLTPNVEQVVRLLLKKTPSEEGEWRAHIRFEQQEDEDDKSKLETGSSSAVQLKARMAVAIPVIVRHGNVKNSIQIQNLKLAKSKDGRPGFSFDLLQEGKKNFYGDIVVVFTPKEGKPTTLLEVSGVSSYIPKRLVHYPFQSEIKEAPKNGTLQVEVRDPSQEGSTVLTTATIEVP